MERAEIIEFLKTRPAFPPEEPLGVVEEHQYSIISKSNFVAIAIDDGDFEEIPKEEFMTTQQLCADTKYYLNIGDLDSAMECIQCALQVDVKKPEEDRDWEVYYVAGTVAFRQKAYDASINLMLRGLELGCPEVRKSYDHMAVASSIQDRPEKAFNYYKLAIDCTPDDPQAWSNLGGFYWDYGLLPDAVYAYTKSLDLDIGYEPTYEEMKNLTLEMENPELSQAYAEAIQQGTQITQETLDNTHKWLSGLELENESLEE